MKGILYLIPTDLGNDNLDVSLPLEVRKTISELRYFIVENVRTARRFLKKNDRSFDIDQAVFFEIDKHKLNENEAFEFLQPALQGNDIGILSEAGCPCIADPGNIIVRFAHQFEIIVNPLVGPNSILLALISSGMNGQSFAFSGYLPIQKNDRTRKIKELENRSRIENQTQIFMETPYRNNALLEDLISTCNKSTHISVALDLTLPSQQIISKTVWEWKNMKFNYHKRPAIFLISSTK